MKQFDESSDLLRVILSAAKNGVAGEPNHKVLRCAQNDKMAVAAHANRDSTDGGQT